MTGAPILLPEPRPVERRKQPTLSERTLVPFSLVGAILTVFIGATWWLRGALSDIGFEQRLTNEKIARIESAMNIAAQDNVNTRDLRLFLMDLARKNPNLAVPEWGR